MNEEKLKHGKRLAKTKAVSERRFKKFQKEWTFIWGTETKEEARKNNTKLKSPHQFHKWDGNCNSPMCHPKYEREKQRQKDRKEIRENLGS